MKNRRNRRLIQEDLTDPWQILVACVLLNRSTGKMVRPVFAEVIHRWPMPQELRDADMDELIDVIRSVGLQKIKAIRLQKMSRDWLNDVPLKKVYGVGQYAIDSYRIFIEGVTSIRPTDRRLREYLKRKRYGARR